MVAHDPLSQALTALACFILVYLATFEHSFVVLFPAVLLVSGISLQLYFARRIEVVEVDARSLTSVAVYSMVALAGMLVVGAVAPFLLPAGVRKMELAKYDVLLYSVLIAIAEEQFFRGALLNFLLTAVPPALAVVSSAAVFMVYHLAVYGSSAYSLVYVFAGGLLLAWVTVRSGRISPAMVAHVINNALAVM